MSEEDREAALAIAIETNDNVAEWLVRNCDRIEWDEAPRGYRSGYDMWFEGVDAEPVNWPEGYRMDDESLVVLLVSLLMRNR